MAPRRLPTLDGLRGVAVMGIVLMNIAGFALPSGAYFNPRAWGTPSSADLALWAASFVLVDGKMRALFSILFGASVAIVATRAEEAGDDPMRVHLARMGTLALFGIAHGVLLWPGDILVHYAIVGCFALPLVGLAPRQQMGVAAMLLALQAFILIVLLAGDMQACAAGGADWGTIAASIGIGPRALVLAEIALHRGGWATLAAANAREMLAGVPVTLLFDGPETLAFMAIGMAALSSGFLTGDWPRAAYRKTAAIILGVALPLAALLALVAARSGFDTLTTFAVAMLGGLPLRPAIALGYAALLVPRLAGAGARRLRAAGRMAFSNYLLTSLVMTAVFDGWGLGLYARLGRAQAMAIVPLAWIAMLAWSAPWLAYFRFGPLEWAWRSLAQGRILSLRRSSAIASA